MVIATFTSGDKTIIGCRKDQKNDIIRIIDSKLLYSDPDKLVGRFYVLISKLFGVNTISDNDKIIFALSGDVNSRERVIVDSTILNGISFQKHFNGFNFIEAFSPRFEEENIHLINDADCLALTMSKTVKHEPKYPVLSVYMDEGVGVSIIQKNKIINYQSIVRPIEDYDNKTAHQLLFEQGLDEMLIDYWDNIMIEYTSIFTKVLQEIFYASTNEGLVFNEVFIFSGKREYILEDILFSKFPNVKFSFFGGSANDSELTIKGIFNYFEENNQSEAFRNLFNISIEKIEYYSANEEPKNEFANFNELIIHWEASKPIASGKNYYLISYSDGLKTKFYLEQLNSITDIQKLKF